MAGFRRFGSWFKKSIAQKSRRAKSKKKLAKQPEKKDEEVCSLTFVPTKPSINDKVHNDEDVQRISEEFPTYASFKTEAMSILDAIIKRDFHIETITCERALEEELLGDKHPLFIPFAPTEWEPYCDKYKKQFGGEIFKHFPPNSRFWSTNTPESLYNDFIIKLQSQQVFYIFWKKDVLDMNKALNTKDAGGLLNIVREKVTTDKSESLQTSAEKLALSESESTAEPKLSDGCEFLGIEKKRSESKTELLQKPPRTSTLTAEAVRCIIGKVSRLLDDAYERDFSPTTFEKIHKKEMKGKKNNLPGTEEWKECWEEFRTRIETEISKHFSAEWEWEKALCSMIQKQFIDETIEAQDRQCRDYIFWKELEKRKNSNLENPKCAGSGETLATNVKTDNTGICDA